MPIDVSLKFVPHGQMFGKTAFVLCLLNHSFGRRLQQTWNSVSLVFVCGNPPATGGFSSKRASNVQDVSIWWRHHGNLCFLPLRHYHWLLWLKACTRLSRFYMIYCIHLHSSTCNYRTTSNKQVLFQCQLNRLISCLQFIELSHWKGNWPCFGR